MLNFPIDCNPERAGGQVFHVPFLCRYAEDLPYSAAAGTMPGRSRRAIVPRTPFHIISTREGSAGGAMTSGESMSPTFRPVLLLASAVVCVGLSGCGASGPNLHPVEGTVSVKGKPAAGAIVFFHHQDRSSPNEPVPYGKADQE